MTNEEKDALLAKIGPDKLEGICNAITEAVRLMVEIHEVIRRIGRD